MKNDRDIKAEQMLLIYKSSKNCPCRKLFHNEGTWGEDVDTTQKSLYFTMGHGPTTPSASLHFICILYNCISKQLTLDSFIHRHSFTAILHVVYVINGPKIPIFKCSKGDKSSCICPLSVSTPKCFLFFPSNKKICLGVSV